MANNDDLVYNTSSRLPVCLCLDISGSMAENDAIGQLNKGVSVFYEAIRNNQQSANSCEISVITFNSQVTLEEDFTLVDQKIDPEYMANGGTFLATAVLKSLDVLEQRKQQYKDVGVDYYQPWLVLITDGKPTDGYMLREAQQKTKQLVENKKLTVFPVIVGDSNDDQEYKEIKDTLDGFLPRPKAIRLKDLKFEEFFEWLGKSVSAVSSSQVGDKVTLDKEGIDEWGEI